METLGEVNENCIEYRERFIDERKWYERRIEELMSAVEEMKMKREEDMKANERVVAMFASKEEAWKKERKQLMQELDVLREFEKSNNNRIEHCNSGSSSDENKSRKENSDEAGCSIPSIDELLQRLKKEEEKRKMAYKRFVCVVSEIKGQKKKLEEKLRNAIVEKGASKKDAAMKAKEKKHVDAALRKVTEEILRLQKEVDDKDTVINHLCHNKDPLMAVAEALKADLRAKELELSNAKNKLREYADEERNRARDVDKWRRLYLGIKRELDNIHIGSRQSSGLLDNGHSSQGGGQRNKNASRGKMLGGEDIEQEHLERIRCLANEIQVKNEQDEGLRKQVSVMEKELQRKDEEIEYLQQILRSGRENQCEVGRDVMFMKQTLTSYPHLLHRSKSCDSTDHKFINTRQKDSKNSHRKVRE